MPDNCLTKKNDTTIDIANVNTKNWPIAVPDSVRGTVKVDKSLLMPCDRLA